MTYSVNGTPLSNPDAGWELQRGSIPVMSIGMEHTRSRSAGRDGVTVSGGRHSPAELRFRMKLARADAREALFAVFRAPTLVVTDSGRPGWTATGVLTGSSIVNHYDFLDFDEELFQVEISGGVWRGSEVTTPLTAAAPTSSQMTLFEGLSAPVQDATVRLTGPLENPQVLDGSGAFFAVDGTLTAGQRLRFESATGRAWLAISDTWVGGTEVSGLVDFGGPRGVFEITPRITTPTSPTVRDARLVLSQDSFNSGAGFQVRGKPAYLM